MMTGLTLTAVSLIGLVVIIGGITLAFHYWDKND